MESQTARWLTSPEAEPWIDTAMSIADPSSLAAATRLRRDLKPDQAAAVLDLVWLRRRARTKLGPAADSWFLTHAGLEQATRWDVARWRADQIRSLGVTSVIDAGCGLGIDAMACQRLGLAVVGIERDPVVAILAQANLSRDWRHRALQITASDSTQTTTSGLTQTYDMPGARPSDHQPGRVITASVKDLDWTAWLTDPGAAIFLDPARRTTAGRSWRISDLSPSWDWVESIVEAAQGPVVVKLGPGFPRSSLPTNADVTWVSHRGDLVETTVWSSSQSTGARQALILTESDQQTTSKTDPSGDTPTISCLDSSTPPPPPGPLGAYIYEPDPSVIRAQALGSLASRLHAHPVAAEVAYLTGDTSVDTVYAQGFVIDDQLDMSEKSLRAWVRQAGIGVLEIKVRGLDIDPAVLRTKLRLKGSRSATVILTPTQTGSIALVVHRLSQPVVTT